MGRRERSNKSSPTSSNPRKARSASVDGCRSIGLDRGMAKQDIAAVLEEIYLPKLMRPFAGACGSAWTIDPLQVEPKRDLIHKICVGE